MAVLVFQTFIVFSLLACRLLAQRHLTAIALGWSALTLVLVFMPWLMILQLAVIWITYSVLKYRKAAHTPGTVFPDHTIERPAIVSPAITAPVARRPYTSDELAPALEWLDPEVRERQTAIALAPFEAALAFEKYLVEQAMDYALKTVSAQSVAKIDSARVELNLEALNNLDRKCSVPGNTQITDFSDQASASVSQTRPLKAPMYRWERILYLDAERAVWLRQVLKPLCLNSGLQTAFWTAPALSNQKAILEDLQEFTRKERLV